MSEIIKFQDVTKEYITGDTVLKAADKLNFTINQGEFIVILGPSGSGKSTLLNLIGGLDTPTSGDILIDNHNISQYNEKELTTYRAESVGFIFQFYNLIPNLTALENIELINDVLDKKIDGKKYLKQVQLEQHADQFPSQLSGGEQQRVSIARAISKEPALLLCDEPTGALDSKTGYHVIDIILKLSQQKKTTVIIVTHNNQLALLADKIIHLKNGQIEEIEINNDKKTIDQIEW